MGEKFAYHRASFWLCWAVFGLGAVNVHPGFASLLSIALMLAVIFIMRWVATMEGRADTAAAVKEKQKP